MLSISFGALASSSYTQVGYSKFHSDYHSKPITMDKKNRFDWQPDPQHHRFWLLRILPFQPRNHGFVCRSVYDSTGAHMDYNCAFPPERNQTGNGRIRECLRRLHFLQPHFLHLISHHIFSGAIRPAKRTFRPNSLTNGNTETWQVLKRKNELLFQEFVVSL